MSLPEVRGAGKLINDPRTGETKTGGTYAAAVVKFQAWRRNGDDWEPGDAVIASVIAFEDAAVDLARYAKNDDVAIQGSATVTIWKGAAQMKITASKVWTPDRRGKGTQNARTPSVGQTPTQDRARVFGDATENRSGQASSRPREEAAQSPVQLDEHRREAGNRLLRQHAGNARRAGRLA